MKHLLILLLLAAPAHAEVTATVGLGKKVMHREPFERMASIGYKAALSDEWAIKPQVGGWLGGQGKQSWFVSAPVTLTAWIKQTGAYLSAGCGPAYISAPDYILGGHTQFHCEFAGGLKTERVSIGAAFTHFSSAGFHMPNLGRDFVGMTVGVEL